MNKVNILIVDDEALLREGLRVMLEKEDFVSNIYEAENDQDFILQLSQYKIDLILLDIRLKKTTGIELLQKIKLLNQNPKVIAVTGLDGIEVIIHLLKAGVHGIVYKLHGYGEICKSIKAVLHSGNYFTEDILKIIQSNSQRWDRISTVQLSFQENELLKALAKGATTKEMAVELKMRESTAETYRVRLMKKLGVPNTAALLVYAFRNGIL